MGFKKEGKGKSFGARKPFGARSGGPAKFGGARSSERKSNFELFDTTCGRCGKPCQVPFRPTGTKPVFCRDCFNKGGDDAPRPMRNSGPSNFSGSSEELEEINRKLDKIMRAMKID